MDDFILANDNYNCGDIDYILSKCTKCLKDRVIVVNKACLICEPQLEEIYLCGICKQYFSSINAFQCSVSHPQDGDYKSVGDCITVCDDCCAVAYCQSSEAICKKCFDYKCEICAKVLPKEKTFIDNYLCDNCQLLPA